MSTCSSAWRGLEGLRPFLSETGSPHVMMRVLGSHSVGVVVLWSSALSPHLGGVLVATRATTALHAFFSITAFHSGFFRRSKESTQCAHRWARHVPVKSWRLLVTVSPGRPIFSSSCFHVLIFSFLVATFRPFPLPPSSSLQIMKRNASRKKQTRKKDKKRKQKQTKTGKNAEKNASRQKKRKHEKKRKFKKGGEKTQNNRYNSPKLFSEKNQNKNKKWKKSKINRSKTTPKNQKKTSKT